ncbi:MAG: hypothetical protein IJV40_07525 [Oscillospiraceae bacterium]|nr:hypothetical protein [Oscillospiraceae bacterium]
MAGNHEAPRAHRSKRKRQAVSQRIVIICLVLLLLMAVCVIVWLANRNNSNPESGSKAESTAQASQSGNGGLVVPERPEMIDITAYESLEFKADTLEQSVRFDNPLQNNCWLVITLSMEDGTVLWKSEELQPGQVVRSITLNQTLSAGEYNNAILSYQHWTYDAEKEPLNGAETIVTLKVVQ